MQESPNRDEQLSAMFDSYCHSVLRNASRHLKRKKMQRESREQPVDPFKFSGELATVIADEYSIENFTVYADELYCTVDSFVLYCALNAIPLKQRKALILDFWHDWKDKEIAEYLAVSLRTVYNLKQRAYRTILHAYERDKKRAAPSNKPDTGSA